MGGLLCWAAFLPSFQGRACSLSVLCLAKIPLYGYWTVYSSVDGALSSFHNHLCMCFYVDIHVHFS